MKIIEMFGKEANDKIGPSLTTKKRLAAYKEVISKIKEFQSLNASNSFTLKGLFYHVFPSYKIHFELLVKATEKTNAISPQLAALQVGAEPLSLHINRLFIKI